MSHSHLNRIELVEEIKKLESERDNLQSRLDVAVRQLDHWKLKAEQAEQTLIKVINEIHRK